MIDTFSPAMRLLLAASYHGVLVQMGQELSQAPTFNLDVDWHEFQQLVHRHGVVNHVLVGLRGTDAPEAVLQRLNRVAKQAALIGLGQLSEVNRLCAAFEQADIPLLPMKGVRLSERLFGSASFRFSSDIDLLVSAENLYAAQNLLLSQGYQLEHYAKPFNPPQIDRLINTWAKHLNFTHPENRNIVELHWRLFRNRHFLPFEEQLAIAQRASGSTCADKGNDSFHEADLILYLILHGSNHAWVRMRWLLDIAVIVLENDVEWDGWLTHVQALGLGRPVGQAFLLLSELFEIPIPEPVKNISKTENKLSALVTHVYKTWQTQPTALFLHGFQTRAMLKRDRSFHFDELRRFWRNPLKFPFWDLPDKLFPLNSLLSIFIQARSFLLKRNN